VTKRLNKNEFGKTILFRLFSFFLLMKCSNRIAVQCKMFAGALEILTTVQKLAAKEHSGWQWECVDVDLCIC
jgi:hypothetical protein